MISRFVEEENPAEIRAQIKEIFFLSSRRMKVLRGVAREQVFGSWAGYYLDKIPDQTLLFKTHSCGIVGYLTGCFNSAGARPLYRDLFYYQAFDKWYEQYPAHFHVNCHPDFRSQGIGKVLVETFVGYASQAGAAGVHLVTGTRARNRQFYERQKFFKQTTCRLNNTYLVLLGRVC